MGERGRDFYTENGVMEGCDYRESPIFARLSCHFVLLLKINRLGFV